MDEADERRLKIDNLRIKLAMLENERRALLRELSSPGLLRDRRAEVLVQRAVLQLAHDQATTALRNLGEPVNED